MTGRDWTVGKYHFSDVNAYRGALRDQQLIDAIEKKYHLDRKQDVDTLYKEILNEKYHFVSTVGRDFDDKIYELHKQYNASVQTQNKVQSEKKKGKHKRTFLTFVKDSKSEKMKKNAERVKGKPENQKSAKEKSWNLQDYDQEMQKEILRQVKVMEKRRRLILAGCALIGTASLACFAHYYISSNSSNQGFENLAELKDSTEFKFNENYKEGTYVHVNKDGSKTDMPMPDILKDYKTLYMKNKRLIGWLKIADTIIDYPVLQTVNNEYYLSHNFEQEEDRNGCIFMDYRCNAIEGSDNFILYGHHMRSGKMFGSLYKYEDEDFGKEHAMVEFDTIFEKATYEVMYVFRSRVYSEEDVTFKYYDFIDANSAKEFDSHMNEMAAMAYYDTGVTAQYGDQLLTLSTCDYEESEGRFVVVCKRVK